MDAGIRRNGRTGPVELAKRRPSRAAELAVGLSTHDSAVQLECMGSANARAAGDLGLVGR